MNDPGDRFFERGDIHALALRPYTVGDERKIVARADFAAALAEEGRLPQGPKWTLAEGGTVWAVGGVEPLGAGTWGAWAYAADMPPRAWVFGSWAATAVLGWLFRTLKPLAVSAEAAPTPTARRLLARIGFHNCRGDNPDLFVMTGPV